MDVFDEEIDGFLFVYNMGNPRFTAEEKEAFQQIRQQVSIRVFTSQFIFSLDFI